MTAPVFNDLDDTPVYTENSFAVVLDADATIVESRALWSRCIPTRSQLVGPRLDAHRRCGEAFFDEQARSRMRRRGCTVDFTDQHAASALARRGQVQQHPRNLTADARAQRFGLGEEQQELPLAAAEVGRGLPIDEDDERSGRPRRSAP